MGGPGGQGRGGIVKHVFYVIYVLFYTGAVFVTGLFVGQLLERSWAARRREADDHARSSSPAVDSMAHGAMGRREEAAATVIKRN